MPPEKARIDQVNTTEVVKQTTDFSATAKEVNTEKTKVTLLSEFKTFKDLFNGLKEVKNDKDIKDKSSAYMATIGDIMHLDIPFLGEIGSLFGTKWPIDLLGTKENRAKKKGLNRILSFLGIKGGLEGIHEGYIEEQLKGVDKKFAKDCYKEYKNNEKTDIQDDQKTRNKCGLEVLAKNMKPEEKTTLQNKIPQDFEGLKNSVIKQLQDPNNIAKLNISTVNMVGEPFIGTNEDGQKMINVEEIKKNINGFADTYIKLTIPQLVDPKNDFINSSNVNADTFAFALFGNLTGEKFFVEGVNLGIKNLLDEMNDGNSSTSENTNESYTYTNADFSSFEGDIKKENTEYRDIVSTVIQKIEGGYYSPTTMYTARMGKSGETMMGIDRKRGGNLNTSTAGKEFWKLIDADKIKNPNSWKQHGYKGGSLEPKLRALAGDIIKPHYEDLCKSYLSEESIKLINTDGRLMFNFIYGARNGAGWFQKMANELNSKVASGIKDTNILTKAIVDWRIHKSGNSLIAQGGKKIENIVGLAA